MLSWMHQPQCLYPQEWMIHEREEEVEAVAEDVGISEGVEADIEGMEVHSRLRSEGPVTNAASQDIIELNVLTERLR